MNLENLVRTEDWTIPVLPCEVKRQVTLTGFGGEAAFQSESPRR
jgi:hypothetical protein